MRDNVAKFNSHDSEDRYEPPRPQGHHVILASMIKKKQPIEFELMHGDFVDGIVTQFDEQTITIRNSDTGQLRTYYKHGILSFGRGAETMQ